MSGPRDDAGILASVVLHGDISGLTDEERVRYYASTCARLGLDPATQPLALVSLSGRLVLYPTRGATDQLARIHGVTRELLEGPEVRAFGGVDLVYARARASTPDGRAETSVATLPLPRGGPDATANAVMKAETKAKRRATLALLGYGLTDESELDTIPPSQRAEVRQVHEPPPTLDEPAVLAAMGAARDVDALRALGAEVAALRLPPGDQAERLRRAYLARHRELVDSSTRVLEAHASSERALAEVRQLGAEVEAGALAVATGAPVPVPAAPPAAESARHADAIALEVLKRAMAAAADAGDVRALRRLAKSGEVRRLGAHVAYESAYVRAGKVAAERAPAPAGELTP